MLSDHKQYWQRDVFVFVTQLGPCLHLECHASTTTGASHPGEWWGQCSENIVIKLCLQFMVLKQGQFTSSRRATTAVKPSRVSSHSRPGLKMIPLPSKALRIKFQLDRVISRRCWRWLGITPASVYFERNKTSGRRRRRRRRNRGRLQLHLAINRKIRAFRPRPRQQFKSLTRLLLLLHLRECIPRNMAKNIISNYFLYNSLVLHINKNKLKM